MSGETVKTKIIGYKHTVTEYGCIYTNIKIEPLIINGAIITNIPLRNIADFNKLRPKINDVVEIRVGSFIPEFINTNIGIRDPSHTPILIPDKCPICESALSKNFSGTVMRCINSQCDRVMLRQVYSYLKYCCFDQNLQFYHIYSLYSRKLIRNLASVYKIMINDYISIGFSFEEAKAIYGNIQEHNKIPLQNLYYSLDPEIATNNAIRLASLKSDTDKWYAQINKIESNMFIDNDKNNISLDNAKVLLNKDLRKNILVYKELDTYIKIQPVISRLMLSNRRYVIDSVGGFKKDFLKILIRLNGGEVVNGISKIPWSKVNYIISDTPYLRSEYMPGSNFGIPIVPIEEVLNELGININVGNKESEENYAR